MAYKNEFLATVRDVISHGRQEGVEKLTLTWEQWTVGGKPPLHHAITVTYRDKGLDTHD